MFSKQQFYNILKPQAKTWAKQFHEFLHFEPHYTLIIGMSGIESNVINVDGKQLRDIKINCQLINRKTNQTFRDKYVCPDLNISCIKEEIRSDYQLFKYLEKHYTKAISEYEAKFPEWAA